MHDRLFCMQGSKLAEHGQKECHLTDCVFSCWKSQCLHQQRGLVPNSAITWRLSLFSQCCKQTLIQTVDCACWLQMFCSSHIVWTPADCCGHVPTGSAAVCWGCEADWWFGGGRPAWHVPRVHLQEGGHLQGQGPHVSAGLAFECLAVPINSLHVLHSTAYCGGPWIAQGSRFGSGTKCIAKFCTVDVSYKYLYMARHWNTSMVTGGTVYLSFFARVLYHCVDCVCGTQKLT